MNRTVFISIGSNLGNRKAHLNQCRKLIDQYVCRIIKTSSIYETRAWGKTDQPDFLNQVIQVECSVPAVDLLEKILSIEMDMGRLRKEKWGARVIDIDIIYFGDEIIASNQLIIPHPRMHERNFVLIPLAEISPDFVHPLLKKSNEQLACESSDRLSVKIFKD
ncbi:MAG: 2-amino-4-hydroxy-6-hydroxymethyldihydropteridine diphosphokinase [Bacteroidetes bacterium]|nr:2-amino-4-hydroxy-6-hydroxymethyldihydropteridine diphosphokinase [Bacteroidota bacterium]